MTSIEWVDKTWNLTRDYAEKTGKGRLVPSVLAQPLKWRKPRRVFVDSMSDLFFEAFSFEEIAAVFGIMAACPQHTFQVLTKRPARALEFFEWYEGTSGAGCSPYAAVYAAIEHMDHPRLRNALDCNSWPLPNVHLGVSVEDQAAADERIPHLLQCPAAVRFLSVEPMLGPVDMYRTLFGERYRWQGEHPAIPGCNTLGFVDGLGYGIDWVICGGESGNNSRPMQLEWARSLRDQCVAAGVPFLFKQWGNWCPLDQLSLDSRRAVNASNICVHDNGMVRVVKSLAGRLLDGRTWDEFPT